MNKQLQRHMTGAANYAAADKSDPFAYARALTHIRTRIVGLLPNGEDGHYEAAPFTEERFLPDGTSYQATVYRNMKRP